MNDNENSRVPKVRESFPEKDCCNVSIENARPGDFIELTVPPSEDLRQALEKALVNPVTGYGVNPAFEPLRPQGVTRCYPTTLSELVYFVHRFFGKGIDTIREKNQRYASSADPFKNFRLAGQYGIAVRMSDKVSRLLTLLEPGTTVTATTDESIEDTCMDLANYCAILAAMRQNEKE